MKSPIYIFDIDSTLSDASWREQKYLNKRSKEWNKFNLECIKDNPKYPMFNLYWQILVCMLAQNKLNNVYYFTGRSNDARSLTHDWFMNQGILAINDENLYMRPNSDLSRSADLKEKWLHSCFDCSTYYNIIAFDDNPDIINMYTKNGVTAFQVT
jgi:hypothetical protein